MLAGLVHLRLGRIFLCLSLVSGCSLSWSCITTISESVTTWCSPCMSLTSLYKDNCHIGLRVHPTPVWLHLKLITSAKTLFPNKVTFTDIRSKDLNISFGEHNSTHNSYQTMPSFSVISGITYSWDVLSHGIPELLLRTYLWVTLKNGSFSEKVTNTDRPF